MFETTELELNQMDLLSDELRDKFEKFKDKFGILPSRLFIQRADYELLCRSLYRAPYRYVRGSGRQKALHKFRGAVICIVEGETEFAARDELMVPRQCPTCKYSYRRDGLNNCKLHDWGDDPLGGRDDVRVWLEDHAHEVTTEINETAPPCPGWMWDGNSRYRGGKR